MNTITRTIVSTTVKVRCYNKKKDELEEVNVILTGEQKSETWLTRRVKAKLKKYPDLSFLSIISRETESKTYELPVEDFIRYAEDYMNKKEAVEKEEEVNE